MHISLVKRLAKRFSIWIIFILCLILIIYKHFSSNAILRIKNNVPDAIILRESGNIPDFAFISGQVAYKYALRNGRMCSKFPAILDIKFNNDLWQKQKLGPLGNITAYLFNAYMDTREGTPKIRILSMIDDLGVDKAASPSFCQFWYGNGTNAQSLRTSVVEEFKMVWYKPWGNTKEGSLLPFLVTCPIPKFIFDLILEKKLFVSVSLAQKACDRPTNNLRIHYHKPHEEIKGFAVCVKGLDFFNDLSLRLIEWIELLGILGADKVIFYEFFIHPEVARVLDYYKRTEQIEVEPMSLPADLPNDPRIRHYLFQKRVVEKRQTELIPYNDCFYRNLYKYKYIVLLDIDEVIVPMKESNWGDLLRNLKWKGNSSYNAQNAYFFDHAGHEDFDLSGIPQHLHILRHVQRAGNYSGGKSYVKSFFDTTQVLSLHNHYPLSCLKNKTKFCTYEAQAIPPQLAQLQHYRSDCVRSIKNCDKENTILDTNIWRFKEELIRRTNQALGALYPS